MDPLIDHVPALLSVGPCSLPSGWLDTVDVQPPLLDALLCLVGCPLPVDRGDLRNYHADLNGRVLRDWHQHAADTVTRAFPQFPVDSQQWQDACAIMLYTCQSPICYMINGMLTQKGRVANQLSWIAPMARRIFDAVRRLGTPYTGEAFRVMYADNSYLQEPFNNYKIHFDIGKPVNFYQFASFSTEMEKLQSFTDSTRPMIVLKCANIRGFGINDYSAQTFLGRLEAEVLVTPPSYFVVKSRPYCLKGVVIVEVEYLEYTLLSYLSGPTAAAAPLPLHELHFSSSEEAVKYFSTQLITMANAEGASQTPSTVTAIIDVAVKLLSHATTPSEI